MITITTGVTKLVQEAETQINTLTPAQAQQKLSTSGVLLVDLRDIRERKRDGHIPNSLHIPRGMLEFWIDPDSPYYRSEFDNTEEVILYCNKGWRSALAAQTLQTMGVKKVAHIQGGMERWTTDIGEIDKG
ncbi:MAG: rhodanese-like domain-containing protein [Pseudohongiellaceae bacterium]